MMFSKALKLGICVALLASFGAAGYAYSYNTQLFDYSRILGYTSIISATCFVSIFACIMFWVAQSLLPKYGEIIFNALFAFGSMSSIYYAINSNVEGDTFGYFMVYAMPLHFFPVLSWFVLKPMFYRNKA